jgi:hypothetical protein
MYNHFLVVFLLLLLYACSNSPQSERENDALQESFEWVSKKEVRDTVVTKDTQAIETKEVASKEKRNLWDGTSINGYTFYYDCYGCHTSNDDYINIFAIKKNDTIKLLHLPVIDYFVSDVELIFAKNHHFILIKFNTIQGNMVSQIYVLNSHKMELIKVPIKTKKNAELNAFDFWKGLGLKMIDAGEFEETLIYRKMNEKEAEIKEVDIKYSLIQKGAHSFELVQK